MNKYDKQECDKIIVKHALYVGISAAYGEVIQLNTRGLSQKDYDDLLKDVVNRTLEQSPEVVETIANIVSNKINETLGYVD